MTPAAAKVLMTSNSPVRILAISDDDGLRVSRELVLRNEGYEVESLSSQAFLQVGWVRTFDLVIMCQSVHPERAARIADELRRYNPDIRVLRVNPFRTRAEPFYTIDSEVLAGPHALLRAIEDLLPEDEPVRSSHPNVRAIPAARQHHAHL